MVEAQVIQHARFYHVSLRVGEHDLISRQAYMDLGAAEKVRDDVNLTLAAWTTLVSTDLPKEPPKESDDE